MTNSKKPFEQMTDSELLQTQVKLLSKIRDNKDKIFMLLAVFAGLKILGEALNPEIPVRNRYLQ